MAVTDYLKSRTGSRRSWSFAGVSLVVHAGLIAALVATTDDERVLEGAPGRPGEVTYVDIASMPPPPPPTEAAPQPEESQPTPQEPRPEPRPEPLPETPPRPTDIIEPEVDSLIDEPLGEIPPIDAPPPTEGVLRRRAVGAGGQEGGVEGGVEGGRVGGDVGATGVDPGGTYVAAVVDRVAELRNRRELPRIMERLYPTALRDNRIGGRVVVQFVVDTNGRVDPSSVQVMSSTVAELESPTREALEAFRFTPARKGDQNVRMLMQMPVVWQVED